MPIAAPPILRVSLRYSRQRQNKKPKVK